MYHSGYNEQRTNKSYLLVYNNQADKVNQHIDMKASKSIDIMIHKY